jgi:hypothetical protein
MFCALDLKKDIIVPQISTKMLDKNLLKIKFEFCAEKPCAKVESPTTLLF